MRGFDGLDGAGRRPWQAPPAPCAELDLAPHHAGDVEQVVHQPARDGGTCRSIMALVCWAVAASTLGILQGFAAKLRIGAKGLRNSWARVARNSSSCSDRPREAPR